MGDVGERSGFHCCEQQEGVEVKSFSLGSSRRFFVVEKILLHRGNMMLRRKSPESTQHTNGTSWVATQPLPTTGCYTNGHSSSNGRPRGHGRNLSDVSSQENGSTTPNCSISSTASTTSDSNHDSGSKPLLLKLSNTVRARLRHLTAAWRNVDVSNLSCDVVNSHNNKSIGRRHHSRSKKGGGGGGGGGEGGRRRVGVALSVTLAYLACCVVLLWIGTQLPALMRGWIRKRRLSATSVDMRMNMTERGRGAIIDDGIGPRLAYGIMVYQRQGYAVEKTLGQFTRMFDAIYDEQNT